MYSSEHGPNRKKEEEEGSLHKFLPLGPQGKLIDTGFLWVQLLQSLSEKKKSPLSKSNCPRVYLFIIS